jgi:hypothetical protein
LILSFRPVSALGKASFIISRFSSLGHLRSCHDPLASVAQQSGMQEARTEDLTGKKKTILQGKGF